MFRRVVVIIGAIVGSLLAATAARAAVANVDELRTFPVLDNGRVKPWDTLARETVRFVTGSERFGAVKEEQGLQSVADPMDPVALTVDWAANWIDWQKKPVLYVPLIELRKKLGMTEAQKWITPDALRRNEDFKKEAQRLTAAHAQAEQTKEVLKTTRLEDATLELSQRLAMFDRATDLTLYSVLPVPNHGDEWFPLKAILDTPVKDNPDVAPLQQAWTGMLAAWKAGNQADFDKSVQGLATAVTSFAGPNYVDRGKIDREVFYNTFKPFRVATVIYMLALIALIASTMLKPRAIYWSAIGLFGAAILFEAWAFLLRCTITGWAPVTNMYETVIWVAGVGAIFSMVLELIYQRKVIAIGGAIVAVIATVVADVMPPEYGNSIRNLTPVLRSNYWLTIHVLTIVSSYAAFALALILGNIVLGQYMARSRPESIRQNLQFTYRAVQIGVLLVATGTYLGGMWADKSWGRFWGWDPKEVWALIVLLTYLALLHGRFAGWIGQFGLAAGAVLCFTAVLMSWYGVNFVLGVGLHAYGFGTGGQGYVATFVLLQWAFVALAWMVHKRHLAEKASVAEERAVVESPEEYPGGATPIAGK